MIKVFYYRQIIDKITNITAIPADRSFSIMKILFIVTIFTFAFSSLSAEPNETNNQFYNELLEKHEKTGHLNKSDIRREKFNLSNDKRWQKKFSKQVRGVASKLRAPRDVIELDNPAIVIPVK